MTTFNVPILRLWDITAPAFDKHVHTNKNLVRVTVLITATLLGVFSELSIVWSKHF